MKQRLTLLKLPSLLLVTGTLLLMVSALAACGAARQGSILPVATVGLTPTLDPNDKYAWDRALAPTLTSRAAIPTSTREWPLPTIAPDLTPAAWPPNAVPYRAAGAGYILVGVPLGMSSSTFKDTNLWVERLPDRHIGVFAGGDGYAGDPTQGLLVISVRTPPPDDALIGDFEMYRTPTRAGPITITDAVGERLTLQAADGTRFYFDVATRQWVNP